MEDEKISQMLNYPFTPIQGHEKIPNFLVDIRLVC